MVAVGVFKLKFLIAPFTLGQQHSALCRILTQYTSRDAQLSQLDLVWSLSLHLTSITDLLQHDKLYPAGIKPYKTRQELHLYIQFLSCFIQLKCFQVGFVVFLINKSGEKMMIFESLEHLSPVRRMVPSWKYICLRCNKCQTHNLWHDKEKIVIFVSFLISPNLYLQSISAKIYTHFIRKPRPFQPPCLQAQD